MDNDFCRYSIGRFVYLIKYIESVFYSLETHCISITDRLNKLNSRIISTNGIIAELDCKKEFRIIEKYSIRDFMLLDEKSNLKNSYYLLFKDCEKLIVLIKENFPKYFNYSSKIFNKVHKFSERGVEVTMADNQSRLFQQVIRCQNKEDLKIKSKKVSHTKNKKINNFRSSIEKLFRFKSKSEKSLKNDDLLVGKIPSTIYLSPQQKVSLSRNTWYIANNQQIPPVSKELIRHSCSDFVCHRSSTFCITDDKNLDNVTGNTSIKMTRAISPMAKAFYPVTEEDSQTEKVQASPYHSVPHSTSMPTHLSKSHQNITKCNKGDLDNIRPAKRTARKKGLFNCSLFRKRSNSRSKSTEKITEEKSTNYHCRDQSKSLTRSGNKTLSVLSDRCLTLPNLKSSEVDLTQNINKHQLFSMDLLKDYLNRSDNSLQISVQRNSIDCSDINGQQQFAASVRNSPLLATNCKCDLKKFKTSKQCFCNSMIMENPGLSESFYSQASASHDVPQSRCSRGTSPLTINNSAFENSCHKYSGPPIENPKPPCVRQISAPVYYQQTPGSHQHLSSTPTNSAFEFWTRPYQEKMKASRRRLLDDKVGSKEALLRSLSPHNIKTTEGNPIYDNPHHLHIIPEPSSIYDLSDTRNYDWNPQGSISHSNSFYNAVQYRLTSPDSVLPEYRPHSSTSPVIENRLLESPKSNSQRKVDVDQMRGNNYLIYNADLKSEPNQPTLSATEITQNTKGKNQSILSLQVNPFGSLSEIKENKSLYSSRELILTRTPTPPHSFAESSISSVYPAPTEFISDLNKPQSQTHKPCGTVNLLYTSDNSDDENDEFSNIEIEPMPPIPPPRTDSVVRSLQAQQSADADKSELEYDISDEFPPVFSGANIDRCDIEQYHRWLEKLPYKLSEFPNILQCRKSAVTACKISPVMEDDSCFTKKVVDLSILRQLRSSRKSIKSWNTSDSSKPGDDISIDSNVNLNSDSHSMKKSFSYDQSLNISEKKCIEESSATADTNQQIPTADPTLLKQYSHLYSLKPPPSQIPKFTNLNPSSAIKFNRSKSIDLRNIINNISSTSVTGLEKIAQKRKSVPNEKLILGKVNEISGKSINNTTNNNGSEYKVYPML